MSCGKFEEWIALHVEDDLEPKEAAIVERRLGQCTARHERLAEEVFAELRRSILVNVRPPSVGWKYAGIAAVLVMAATALFLRGPQQPQLGRALPPAAAGGAGSV